MHHCLRGLRLLLPCDLEQRNDMMTSSNGNIFRVTGPLSLWGMGIHRSLRVDFPQKGQWRGALMFSLICPWTNGSVNNRNADDLRHHNAHYDATLTNICPFRIHIPCTIVCRGCDCCLHVIWNDGMNAPFDMLMHDSLKPADAFICQWNGLLLVNSVRATFFRGNINMYLHLMSFLHTDMP